MTEMRPVSAGSGIDPVHAGPPSRWRRLLAEPLLHFAIIGAMLFGGDLAMGGDRGVESDRIVIDDGTVGNLILQFANTWQRQPTKQEMKSMLDKYVRDEALYRQGLAMGLDKDDAVIRNRVLQKLQVITEETQETDPPSDSELERFMRANMANYASPPVLSLSQIYFDPAQHNGQVNDAVEQAKAALARGADLSKLGDATLLPRTITNLSADALAREFGEQFPVELAKHPVGQWFGPVTSGVGIHLVRISARVDGKMPKLDEVRPFVLRDWEAGRRERNAEAFADKTRKDYKVIVEADLPDDAMPDGARR